jgi:three-Cys-motif partner protein
VRKGPAETLWPLDEHTRGKHEVLREYLSAWFPILGSFAGRIAFIDGFAGPGQYSKGEPGSPLIALDVFRQHAARIKGEAVFLFVEEDTERAAHLEKVIESRTPLPSNCKYEVATSDFETKMSAVLDSLKTGQIAPAFMMLDPFGVAGMPMSLVTRLLKSGKTELYITFMYEFIDRFKKTPAFEKRLTELYGTDAWKDGLALEGRAKREFFFGLYKEQLLKSGARYVLRFDLYRGGHLVYALFFATKHWKGADVMKRAIWKVAPFGDFAFRSARYDQLILGMDAVDYSPLRTALLEEFRGKGPVTIDRIEQFVAGHTDFHIGQLRKHALVPLEKEGLLEILTPRKRARTYPDGTKIRFL